LRPTLLVAAVLAVTSALPTPLSAQQPFSRSQGFFFSVNVLAGGTSALVRSLMTDASPLEAFLGGSVGGAVTYTGMRLVGAQQDALIPIGMQTTALGANIVRNSGDGIGLLSDVTLPVLPLYVRYQTRRPEDPRVSVRLSAASAVSTIYFAKEFGDNSRFMLRESLLAGAPAFRGHDPLVFCSIQMGDHCARGNRGLASAGTTIYGTSAAEAITQQVRFHELIHTAQFHRDAITHAIPVSDWSLRSRSRPGTRQSGLARYIVIDVFLPFHAIGAATTPLDGTNMTNYLEREADAMLRVDRCLSHGTCRW
jgi:hypothetical protein